MLPFYKIYKHCKRRIRKNRGKIAQLKIVTSIRFIGTVARHCVVPTDAREGRFDTHVADFSPDSSCEVFDEGNYIVLVHEGHFNIHLREFRLPIGTQILVAETLHDLHVPIEPTYHQKLLRSVLMDRIRLNLC